MEKYEKPIMEVIEIEMEMKTGAETGEAPVGGETSVGNP